MKWLIKILIVTAFIVVIPVSFFGQNPPHPNNGGGPGSGNTPVGGGAPIDGGLITLFIISFFYSSNKFLNKKIVSKTDKL